MSKRLRSNTIDKKRVVFVLLYLIILVLMMEVVSRAYLVVKYGLPFFSPNDIVFVYYPELREPKAKSISRKDANIDILLLGGSVLSKKWSSIESRLGEKVKSKTKRNVNIYNLALPAHSSLDSYYKYRYLQDKQFDLVVFYHGINEVRANNCPPSIFKEDYSHYWWYERVNLVFNNQKELDYITFLWNIRSLILDLKNTLFKTKYVPAEIPMEEWIDYGSDIKTIKSFENNITRLLNIARNKNEPVLLMTFAYYVPIDYPKFRDECVREGNTKRCCPTEVWGNPENVVRGLEVHNRIIKRLGTQYKKVLFVDQNKLLPKDVSNFNDICHLTDKGSEEFVDNMLQKINEAL